MVTTRRGTRVVSPAQNTNDETEPTPSTRRTRHGSITEGNESQPDDSAGPSFPSNQPKRETRRSTRHPVNNKQPDSTHEADVSESESCCSVVSDVQATPRTRRRTVGRVNPKGTAADDVSEVESCSSAVSATRCRRAPPSLRKRVQTPSMSDATKTDDGDVSGVESCSSEVSLTKVLDHRMITRSCRKAALATIEADPSELDSCSSSVSGIQGSTVRRSARNQRAKRVQPIPLSLEQTTDAPSSPVSRRKDRRSKATSEEVSDSDDCKSGPSTSPWRSARRQAKGNILIDELDSESVPTDFYISQESPSSLRGRGTPCSSRTSSASSHRAVPVTRTRSKVSTTLTSVPTMPEDEEEPMDMETSEAQECTMIEDPAVDITLVLEPDVEDAEKLEPESAELLEGCGDQEQAVDEMVATVTEDRDVAMENNEPEFVKTNHTVEDQSCSEDAVDARTEDHPLLTAEKIDVVTDVEEMAEDEKGVEVSKETTSVGGTSTLVNDAECPSSSSHTQADFTSTEQPSKISPSLKEMTCLLESSEDEESSDEGLSGDEEEEEGSSQEAVDGITEEMMHPDEGQSSAGARSNGLFVIDTRPGLRPDEKYYVDAKQTEVEDEEEFIDEEEDEEDEDSKVLFAPIKPLLPLSSSIDTGLKMKELGGLYISFDGSKPKGVPSVSKTQNSQNNQDELLKKSVLVPDLEKKDALPQESKRGAKLKRKTEQEKTTGDGWFNMKAPEVTEELRNDLKALQMRSAMDPKRFYKKNDREGFPKYFQVGTVVDSPVDFYNSRIPKKQRKRTIVEELLADAEFRSYNKRKYQEIMTEKAAHGAGKMNKKHKFHKKKMNK